MLREVDVSGAASGSPCLQVQLACLGESLRGKERNQGAAVGLVLAGLLKVLLVSLQCGWYWGPMNWEDAEMKLKGKPDGSFLVRDSSDPRYILSLSFRSQGVTHHTRMEHYRGETHTHTHTHTHTFVH